MRLNDVSKGKMYPSPQFEETLARLKNKEIFSIMDLQLGNWQVPIRKNGWHWLRAVRPIFPER
jgi:hypothetical protein